MREFLSSMLNPVALLYLLLVAGLILLMMKWKRAGRFFLVLAGAWFIIISTPFIPGAVIRSLEGKYSQISDSSINKLHGPTNIIVLGGGHTENKNLSPNNQISARALCRLVEAIRVHRLIPGSKLVLSGYKGSSDIAQALVQYRTALILGIDSASMVMQTTPSNTRMEAEVYAKTFGNRGNLILVTSASHMPRAMMHFRNVGIEPIPASTDFQLKNEYLPSLLPSSDFPGWMKVAIHEYVGIIWARLGGN